MTGRLALSTISWATACEFVGDHHRHHKPPRGHKFSIAAMRGLAVVGVAIVGRPVARMRQDGYTLEVTRLCTKGDKNACSFLYGAAARAAWALGYFRIGTYTLASEPGTSLIAAGWKRVGTTRGGSWSRPSRERIDDAPTEPKVLWELTARLDRERKAA